jgi:hypothetical protein
MRKFYRLANGAIDNAHKWECVGHESLPLIDSLWTQERSGRRGGELPTPWSSPLFLMKIVMSTPLQKTATDMLRTGPEVTTAATWLAAFLTKPENEELLLEAGLLLARDENRTLLIRLLIEDLKSMHSVEAVN